MAQLPTAGSLLIQDRQRLFREGLALVLADRLPARHSITVKSPAEVIAAIEGTAFDSILLEAEGCPWDGRALLSHVGEAQPSATMVGTSPFRSVGIPLADGVHIIHRWAGPAAFLTVLSGGGRRATASEPRSCGLSPREREVLTLISGGFSTEQIGRRLRISPKTVESHKEAMFAKLGVQSQAKAVALGLRQGVIGVTGSTAPRTVHDQVPEG